MNKIDQIKAEIERRIAAYQKNFDKADNKIAKLSTDGRIASLKELLPFINSLPEEHPSEDLEKEIERVWDELMQPNFMDFYAFADFAHHFANWQKEQVIGIIEGRIAEILGDAQPAPILRMELDDIIKRIKED